MHTIESIHLSEVSEWTQLRPEEASAMPSELRVVGGRPYAAELLGMHNSHATVAAVGCHSVDDCQLNTGGILTRQGVLLRERAILTDYMEGHWLNGRLMPDGSLFAPDSIVVDSPAICLYSAGVKVYGHWLMEFIPRAAIARQVMGDHFSRAIIPIPREAPAFVETMLELFAGVKRSQILRFDPSKTSLQLKQAVVPTYAHTAYHLHSYFADVFTEFVEATEPTERLWIVRADYSRISFGEKRILTNQDALIKLAAEFGYTPVEPSQLSLREQIRLFRSAKAIVGEFGSSMHNAIFSQRGTNVACIRAANKIQSRIAARFEHVSFYICPEDERVEDGVRTFSAEQGLVRELLENIG